MNLLQVANLAVLVDYKIIESMLHIRVYFGMRAVTLNLALPHLEQSPEIIVFLYIHIYNMQIPLQRKF